MTLEELKRQATEEFDKQWTEIMGLETDPDGQEDMYLIYDDNEEVVNAIDFSPEKEGVKCLIDFLISKAYEECKKERTAEIKNKLLSINNENKDITSFGDGFEKAMGLAIDSLTK